MRKSLYLKDDDYRLSFLYGNFTTLTRFTEADLERVVTEGLSPLNVTIHATDPDVRADMLRNRRGATQPAVAAGPARPRHRGARPGRGVPRAQRRRRARRHAGRRARPSTPSWPTCASCPLGVSPVQHRAAHAAAHPRRGRSVWSTSSTTGRRRSSRCSAAGWCSPPTSTTCSPAGRSRPPRPTRASRCTRTASAWPAPSSSSSPVDADERRSASEPGFFAWVDGAPAEGYRAPDAGTGPRSRRRERPTHRIAAGHARGLAADAPVGVLTGALRRPGARAAGRRDSAATTCGSSPVENRFFGGNIGVTGLMVGEDLARVLADEPDGHRYLLPDVCLSGAGSSTAPTPDDLPRPVEIVPTDGAARCGGALEAVTRASPSRAPARRRHRRPPQRRQVDAAEPRSSAVARRSSRRSRASPATARRSRPSGRASIPPGRHRRLAARRRRRSTRRCRQQPSGRWPRPTSCCSWSTPPSASPRRTPRSPTSLRRLGRRCSWWPTRSTTPAARPPIWELMALGLGEPVAGVAPCTAGAPATCSTRSSPVLPDAERRRGARARRAPSDDDGASCSAVAHRRAAQRRQVDAVQPAHRRGPRRSCTTCRAPPATRSTPWSRPTTARSASSTPPGMRRKAKIDEGTEYYSLVRALQAVDAADVALLVIDATEGVTHQDQRLAERIDAAGCPIVVAAQQVGAARRRGARPTCIYQVSRPAALPRRRRRCCKISALTGQGRAPAAARPLETASRPTTGGCRPGRSTRSSARRSRRQPGPHGARVLYATQGATDPPTFTLFANKRAAAALPALPRAQAPRGVRPRRHADQDAGPRRRSS